MISAFLLRRSLARHQKYEGHFRDSSEIVFHPSRVAFRLGRQPVKFP
jgi:hypothetical protein